jgi:hypothetical protein
MRKGYLVSRCRLRRAVGCGGPRQAYSEMSVRIILALIAVLLLAACQASKAASEPAPEQSSDLPRYEFKFALGYDANDELVLKWMSAQPQRPAGGEPLAMQCDFSVQIEESGPLPTSVSISQSHGIVGHKEGDGVRVTSEALVDGEIHRDEQVAGNPDNVVWTARCRIEMDELQFDRGEGTASGSIRISVMPDQPGWHVKHTWLILRTSGGEEVMTDLFK